MKVFSKFLAIVIFISVFTSCNKDETDNGEEEQYNSIVLSRKTTFGEDWIYFSFSTGTELSEIDNTNYATNTDWDIAFNRYNVRTNGGTSGTGQAAVIDLGEVSFDSVTLAPENGYSEDTTIQIVESLNIPNPPIMIDSTGNTTFIGIFEVPTGPGTLGYTPNNHIYVVKTQDGKYVKIHFTSFFNNSGDSGFINFKYFYQVDGSKNLTSN